MRDRIGKHTWKKEELIAYDNASIAEQDKKGKLIAAENKGKTKGKIEGKIVDLPEDDIQQIISRLGEKSN
ncbi:MAG: hypothetical protein AAF806_16925 [Bacteroidota bacterium]